VNNRNRDRPNHRRSFDDDNYEPPRRNFGFAPPSGPQFETPSGPSVRATVKWYNPEKGEIEARNRGYSPYSVETWRTWEYWANKAGCGHLLTRPDGGQAHPPKG
jgi:hypothetical protein